MVLIFRDVLSGAKIAEEDTLRPPNKESRTWVLSALRRPPATSGTDYVATLCLSAGS